MESSNVMLSSIEDFQNDVECFDPTHDDWLTRPLSVWRVTLEDDTQEFDCSRCFSRRLAYLGIYTPVTVVRIRKPSSET